MFYSKSTGGFYEREIHDVIPDDAVEITSDYRWELMAGQSTGKVIVADENGHPILIDPPAADPVQTIRAERDRLLRESDIYALADVWFAMTTAKRAEWAAYRQALRDVPEQPGFATDVTWPVKPT